MRRLLVGLLIAGCFAGSASAQNPPTPVAEMTGIVYNGTTPLLTKFVAISAASNGNNTIVAAVTGKKIRVLAAVMTMSGTSVSLTWQSGAGGAGLTGAMTPTQGQTIVLPYNPAGWFETAAATLLNLSLGGAQTVGGALVYVEV